MINFNNKYKEKTNLLILKSFLSMKTVNLFVKIKKVAAKHQTLILN